MLRGHKEIKSIVPEEKCGSDRDNFSEESIIHTSEEKLSRDESIFPSRTVDFISLRRLTDSHAHLTSPELWPDRENILARAQEAGIGSILNITTSIDELLLGQELSAKEPWIFQAGAVHPHDAGPSSEDHYLMVEKYAHQGKLQAIGETGLDYHYKNSSLPDQKTFLKRHLHLALECHLPVVIHCREAFSDFFDIVDVEYKINGKHAPGVLHCFTGTFEEAEEVIKRGFYLSFSGIITFKKSEELRRTAEMIPLDRLLIETDAPFLAPQSKRGKQNEPAYVREIAETLARIKNLPLEELAAITTANSKRLFYLKK